MASADYMCDPGVPTRLSLLFEGSIGNLPPCAAFYNCERTQDK